MALDLFTWNGFVSHVCGGIERDPPSIQLSQEPICLLM